jgi:hypothetical protein
MSDIEAKKPLHPFVKVLIGVGVLVVAFDVAIGVLGQIASLVTTPNMDPGLKLDSEIRYWLDVLRATVVSAAYIATAAVIIELLDRILWRMTRKPDAFGAKP